MIVYLFAVLFLSAAVIFVVKYFVDNYGTEKNRSADRNKSDVVIITDSDKPSELKEKKVKRDIVLALVFMVICEILILLEKYVFKV